MSRAAISENARRMVALDLALAGYPVSVFDIPEGQAKLRPRVSLREHLLATTAMSRA